MSKSTASAPVVLTGLTAVQIRELLAQKSVTAKVVIAFLREKEAAHGLRFPAKKLLNELTGEETPAAAKPEAKPAAQKPEAKPAAQKPEAKPAAAKPAAAKPAAQADDLAALVAAVAQLSERIAALEAKRAPAAKAAPRTAAKSAAK